MKKIASILAVILMIAMLAGCSLVAVNPDKIVVASIGEKTISKTEFDAYLNAYLSTYGYTVDSAEIAEQLPDLKTSMIEVLVEEAVIANKIAELGFDQISDEEKADAEALIQEWYDLQLKMLTDTYAADASIADPAAEAKATLDDYLTGTYGTTLEAMKQAEVDYIPSNKLYDHVTKDIVVSEEQAKINYAENVANAKDLYDSDIATFTAHHDSGRVLFYIPEGVFYVKHILIGFTDEQKEELTALRGDDDEAVAATADAKREEFLATIQEEADIVLAAVENGGDFDALIAEYGDDPGMKDALYAEKGYMTYVGNPGFVPEFTAGADTLTADGMTTGLVASDFGYHIIRRVSTLTAGEVPFADVKDDIMTGLLENAKEEAYNAAVAAWVAEADVTINDKNL